MNNSSINNSALFGIFMCCGSSIYGLTLTRASMVIPWEVIEHLGGIERLCIYCGAAIFNIWSPSGVFSWWFESLLVGSQNEYFGWNMVEI